MMLPAGPASRPIVNLVRWLRDAAGVSRRLAARYGNVFTLRLPRIATADGDLRGAGRRARHLWTGDPDTLHAGEANMILRSVVGEHSLLVLDGDRHLRERRLMLPPFHGERMRAYGEAMRDATSREIDRWPIGRPFLVHASTQTITLDVIMRTIFGVGADDPHLAPLRDALVRWTTLGTSRLGTALLLLTPPDRADDGPRARDRPARDGCLPWAPLVRAQAETDAPRARADRGASPRGHRPGATTSCRCCSTRATRPAPR